MNSLTKETKLTMLYILLAFTFSVALRMIWVYHFADVADFKFNNHLMINTNDGYYWAEGARDLISGVSQDNDLSPITTATAQLTAFFAKILPVSFEALIFYMPVFLGSLVVIPIILIAKEIKNLEMGFIAALLSSIAWSYYNRSMAGYYDTDMLNIVLPMFLLWSIIWAIGTNQNKYLIITALDILVYRWWYPASYALEFSFLGMILFYTLVWDRKNLYNYKLMSLMLLAMMVADGYIRLALVLAVFFIFRQDRLQKYVYYILGISVVLFFATGGFNPIIGKLNSYIFEDTIKISTNGLQLHFFSVMQTVREAGNIPFETFANRISGHVITFTFAIIGYAFLVYKHRIMLFALPMLGLGFLASVGGLRFTIYAVPVMAFGIGFLIIEITRLISDKKIIRYISYTFFTLLVLYPNVKHIEAYKVPTVFNTQEVKLLDGLKSKASREDYVVAWWDYGYPLRYYSDVKTLTDGGKHSGSVNFPVSYMLTNTQDVSAKLARLDVEYTEKNFQEKFGISNIEQMTKDYGFDDTNDFLLSLSTDIKLPNKTRDIYFYLPFKMLGIYPTVHKFSSIDLMNGNSFKNPFFYKTNRFKDDGKVIHLGSGISLDKTTSTLKIGNQKAPLKRFVRTSYNKNGVFQKQVQTVNFMANLSVIFMQNYNTFLVVDEQTYNSLYIQLMVLEEYDKSLFEMVSSNIYAKIYKLKI